MTKLFYVHRYPVENTFMRRDLELLWSDAYRAWRFTQGDSTYGLSANEKTTLDKMTESIADAQSNPFDAEIPDIRLVFGITPSRRASMRWTGIAAARKAGSGRASISIGSRPERSARRRSSCCCHKGRILGPAPRERRGP
jgi:hypothetical protein